MTLHLMVGLPSSGKTTLARQLEQKYSALRLNPDEWQTRLFGQDAHEKDHNARHSTIEALLLEIAKRVLELGLDVILDYGFWARVERDELRELAAQFNTDLIIHFLKVPHEVLFERLAARNADLPPGTFYIPEAMLKDWLPIFEPPFPDELEYTLVY